MEKTYFDLLKELQETLRKLSERLEIEKKSRFLKTLEEETYKENFWRKKDEAQSLMKKIDALKKEIEKPKNLEEKIKELLAILPEVKKSEDKVFLEKELKNLQKELKEIELKIFLGGKYDKKGAILSIHAGAGGTEACDWAQMLLRMYLKYCEKKGWKYEIASHRPGEEAGIKTATLMIDNDFTYGFLKKEKGVHRLVRLSPFNANKLRQTSFAQVEVLPIIEEEAVRIKKDDLKIEFFRASGHGGQNINKVSTAVRIHHLPTGTVVESQDQRYQDQNRKIAMQILLGKLWQEEEEKKREKIKILKGEHKIAGWGNQIRSYVLHPYKMVKDLRTGYEENNPYAVLDGNLDDFIDAELKQKDLS